MKRTISMFLLVFVLLGVAQAQETKYVSGGLARQMALGGSPNNAYLMDYTDVYTNPAWASKYTDLIYSELGYSFAGYSASGQSAGFTYAVSKGLAVGLSIGKQEGPMFGANSYGSQVGGNTGYSDDMLGAVNNYMTAFGYPALSTNTLRPLQAYAAMKLAGLTLGVAIYRVSYSGSQDLHTPPANDTVNTKDEASLTQTGFKVGALLDMNVMLLDVSALLRINSATGKHTPPAVVPPALSNDEELTMTGTEIALNARLFMRTSDKFTLVPMARFSTFGYEPEYKYAVAPTNKLNTKPNKYSRTDLEVGIGTNITVTGGHVFAGLSLESISLKHDVTSFVGGGTVVPLATLTQTTKYSTSILSLPKVNLGAEFEIASWLTGRVGYFKAFASQTITTEYPATPRRNKEEYKYTFDFKYMPSCSLATADQLLSLGIGLHFDRLSIDGYLCEEWLGDGIYIASGRVNAMFALLSLSYSFN